MARQADVVQERLRNGILNGEFQPGQHLIESDLAARLETSRTPVREAVRRLESEGLVEVLPHRGARVARWEREDLEEIYDIRAELEAFAARRAAARLEPAALGRLAELCDLMEDAISRAGVDELPPLNVEFHGLVREQARSSRTVAMLNQVVQLPLVVSTFHRYDDAALKRSCGHHRELVAALSAADGEWAASVMRSHVLAAKSVLLMNPPPKAPVDADPAGPAVPGQDGAPA